MAEPLVRLPDADAEPDCELDLFVEELPLRAPLFTDCGVTHCMGR